jgi:hypothetical protein
MFAVTCTALKDESRVLGLVMLKGQSVLIDVLETQRAAIQAAVDSGDVSADGFTPKAAGKVEPATESKPEKAKK